MISFICRFHQTEQDETLGDIFLYPYLRFSPTDRVGGFEESQQRFEAMPIAAKPSQMFKGQESQDDEAL